MKLARKFSASDKVIDLISYDYNILPILSRFRIPIGFGTKTIRDTCAEAAIEENVFLLIINFILTGKIDSDIYSEVSATEIVNFLQNSHDYFMNYKFPHIRKNLLAALDEGHNDVNPAIIKFFDAYLQKVRAHFDYEEQEVFPYVRALELGEKSDYGIDEFKRHHDEVTQSLNELKNVIMRFYATKKPDLMYDVLVDLYNCEYDLEKHSDIENHILIPMVTIIEKASL